MKVKFKFNKRHNMYVTLFACFVGIWMMVNRFGLSVKELLSFAIISVALLFAIIVTAALAGWVLRFVTKNRK